MIKQQSLMVYFGHLSWEAIEGMTPFERNYFNRYVEEAIKATPSTTPQNGPQNMPSPPPQPMGR